MLSEPFVSIRNLSKQFNDAIVLDDVSIDIEAGEIFAILGPSGCGKSTLLRILSGFETPSSGQLYLEGKDLLKLKPNKRPINMVFQSYAVFPHMTVEKNVAYGLKVDRVPKREIESRVTEALEQVRLSDLRHRLPHQLSGGQRQRVALARVLVKKPRLLLLDEPLSALDAKLRDAMRLELVKLQEAVGIAFVIVTHDQAEAMAMADRIAIISEGRLRQVASPSQLYQYPVDAFVADFVGKIHCFEVHSAKIDSNCVHVDVDVLGKIALPPSTMAESLKGLKNLTMDSNLIAAIRPENIDIALQSPSSDELAVKGCLGDIAFQGLYSIVEICLENHASLSAVVPNSEVQALHGIEQGSEIWAYWDLANMLLLPEDAGSLPD